ncbi:MAG: hypothetical protein IIA67_08190, partial [Planctomycetes bacterium]|nr:hypothetical protein [Planctomycetota bacterium]
MKSAIVIALTQELANLWTVTGYPVLAFAGVVLVLIALGVRYIPNNRVGIVEKLWSLEGPVVAGRLIALAGQAGYQADVLRGGLHFFYWRWQYRIHRVPLVTVPQGKIGYLFSRDGDPLPPQQTLGRVIACNNFQNARAFLSGAGEAGQVPIGEDGQVPIGQVSADDDEPSDEEPLIGQRGRQRAILREGVYAINLALFVLITKDRVFHLKGDSHVDTEALNRWQQELLDSGGFDPIVVGGRKAAVHGIETLEQYETVEAESASDGPVDTIGVLTVHDGPALPPGQIIAPPVATDPDDANYHSSFQNCEAFLKAGGRRGRQFATLTDGTYFTNRWFATVDLIPKTVVP